jgi:Domain of unknown function (DUF4347)
MNEGSCLSPGLSKLTGASIAASATKTGAATLAGDWSLDENPVKSAAVLAFLPEVMAAYPSVLAASDLDPTFGTGGKVITNFTGGSTAADSAYAVTVQSDGKSVVIGNNGIARYLGDSIKKAVKNDFNEDGKTDVVIRNQATLMALGTSTKMENLYCSAQWQDRGKCDRFNGWNNSP